MRDARRIRVPPRYLRAALVAAVCGCNPAQSETEAAAEAAIPETGVAETGVPAETGAMEVVGAAEAAIPDAGVAETGAPAGTGAVEAEMRIRQAGNPAPNPIIPGGTSSTGPDRPRTVVDASGQTHWFAQPVSRIVSLVPSATATMRALGVEDRLVGRTDHDTARWASDLPSVGGGIGPSVEAIVDLNPEVVVRFEGTDDARTVVQLDRLGMRHITVRPVGIAEVMDQIEIIGALTGVEDRAAALVATVSAELEALRREAARLPKLSMAYVIGGTPPWVAGPGSYIDEIIEVVGGVNAFGDLKTTYAPVSLEEMIARAPQVVLVSERSVWVSRWSPSSRVMEVGHRLSIPGPTIAAGARYVFERLQLHPEGN